MVDLEQLILPDIVVGDRVVALDGDGDFYHKGDEGVVTHAYTDSFTVNWDTCYLDHSDCDWSIARCYTAYVSSATTPSCSSENV